MAKKRFAAHFVWCQEVLRLHYVELDEAGHWVGCYPLEVELASTAFYDGVLIPLPAHLRPHDVSTLVALWSRWIVWDVQPFVHPLGTRRSDAVSLIPHDQDTIRT